MNTQNLIEIPKAAAGKALDALVDSVLDAAKKGERLAAGKVRDGLSWKKLAV